LHFLVQRSQELVPGRLERGLGRLPARHPFFLGPMPCNIGPRPYCQSTRDPMQPTTQGFRLIECGRLPRQQEKRGLKDVLGIVTIVEQPSTHTQNHWAMPAHQGCESTLLAVRDEPME
jgi:hypothetical protein